MTASPKPSNDHELDNILEQHALELEGAFLSSTRVAEVEFKAQQRAKAALQKHIDERVVEAETNAIAWVIGVIDDLHIIENHSLVGDTDKLYKGTKNTIRDRYKKMTGIDPAPSYPIKSNLSSKGENNG